MTRSYLPAAGHDAFLPLYDPIVRLFGLRRALDPLLAQAALDSTHRVLDIGCGTGTLVVAVARRFRAHVSAIDPDLRALEIARRKAARAGVAIRFEQAFADALPFEDGSFDRVFSSMMFHHVSPEERPRVLAEVRRVLAPGGRLEFLDFAAGSHNVLAHAIHGRQLSAAAGDRLLGHLRDAGFADARRVGERRTLIGRIAYYQAAA